VDADTPNVTVQDNTLQNNNNSAQTEK